MKCRRTFPLFNGAPKYEKLNGGDINALSRRAVAHNGAGEMRPIKKRPAELDSMPAPVVLALFALIGQFSAKAPRPSTVLLHL